MHAARIAIFSTCLLALAGLHPCVFAADTSPDVELQRALDQAVTLNLQKVSLAEAFKQIAATAKIPLQVDPASYDLLPYGDTTLVSIDFNQSQLRQALQEVLVPLGLEESVVGGVVLIRPSSALSHIGRRADWEELKLLKDLWASDIKAPAAGAFSLPDAIRGALDNRRELLIPMPPQTPENAGPAAASEKAIQQIAGQLPMSAYRALEMYSQLTGQIWFVEAGALFGGPTGGTIRIMTPRQWIERQLDRPIQLALTNEALEVVVSDLSHASGIRFVPEPGLYQAVPVVSLRSDNGTVRQTLEALAGATRIAFDVRDDSILLHMAPGPGSAEPAKSDNIIGRISVPIGSGGTSVDVFIKESDLPAALDEQRKKQVQDAVQGLQQAWTARASAPATTPAPPTSVPATQPRASGQ